MALKESCGKGRFSNFSIAKLLEKGEEEEEEREESEDEETRVGQEEKQKQACKEECKFEQKLLLRTTHRRRGWDECPKIPLEDETSSRVPVAPQWRPAGWARWAPG